MYRFSPACFSINSTFTEGVPVNISIPTQGVLHTETFGWAYGSQSTRWVLVPGTLIALATILIGGGPVRSSDPLRLIAAAAAGGLNNAFRGLSEKDVKEGEQSDVVLGSIPGRGPALRMMTRLIETNT
ncbi:hypothetical protein B0H13DRAFT_1921059 [Mycena leptocephala]|nr:hypothetical protein B0H13DRAFT_1921059 [Mycena leptocephala]